MQAEIPRKSPRRFHTGTYLTFSGNFGNFKTQRFKRVGAVITDDACALVEESMIGGLIDLVRPVSRNCTANQGVREKERG